MSGSTSQLNTIGTASVVTNIIGWEISVDSPNGYTVQVEASGGLISGTNDIDAVSDGIVTAGSEEYGAKSSDVTISTSTFDTQDSALSTTPQAIGTKSAAAYGDRQFLILKASASSSTVNGTYTQTLTFVATGNY